MFCSNHEPCPVIIIIIKPSPTNSMTFLAEDGKKLNEFQEHCHMLWTPVSHNQSLCDFWVACRYGSQGESWTDMLELDSQIGCKIYESTLQALPVGNLMSIGEVLENANISRPGGIEERIVSVKWTGE